MSNHTLQIDAACCHRSAEPLFAPVSVCLKSNQLAVITGANGAGKTTLLQALAGLTELSAGIRTFDQSTELSPWLTHSHYIGHKLGNHGALTCTENLAFVAQVNQIKITDEKIAHVLITAGLGGYDYQMARDLSAGQKKRLALSRLLLLKKSFWLLDEPFVNLDQAGCDWFFNVIKNHLGQGGAVILSAHDQPKINQLADHQIDLTQPDFFADAGLKVPVQ